MTRETLPADFGERTVLTTFLDYARGTVRAKCAGVSEDDARRSLLPTSPLMTLSGLVSHLHWVEYSWFQVRFLGEEDHGPWTDEDPDREMRIGVEQPIGVLLDAYDEQCARYRELVAAHDLDDVARATIRGGHQVTLRWILLHLLQEISRHNGHIDILREQLDGVTGV
jgi:uncharacterized damage-inducible protein DinB